MTVADPLAEGREYQQLLLSLLAERDPAAVMRMWNASTAEDRVRVGMHSERGPESFELTFRLYAGHDLFHIAQAEKTLRLVATRS